MLHCNRFMPKPAAPSLLPLLVPAAPLSPALTAAVKASEKTTVPCPFASKYTPTYRET
jgi:hypothetical protein